MSHFIPNHQVLTTSLDVYRATFPLFEEENYDNDDDDTDENHTDHNACNGTHT